MTWPPHHNTPEGQWATAPRMPVGRPATKNEVWDWVVHLYAGIWTREKCVQYAKETWAWGYVYYVNFNRWDKQPDWRPGDPIIHEAVPRGPFQTGQGYIEPVERLWGVAQRTARRAA